MLQRPVVNLTPARITSSVERKSELMIDVLLVPKHCHQGLDILSESATGGHNCSYA